VIPPEFANIRADFTTLLLPMLYYGVPVLLLVVSVLMFLSGYFYNKGKQEDEARKKDEIEREMIRKAAERVVRQKAKQAEDAAAKAMEEELEKPQAPEAQESVPPAEPEMIVRKRKK
jgi:predicted Holliday junction resolvase-like endonuclease